MTRLDDIIAARSGMRGRIAASAALLLLAGLSAEAAEVGRFVSPRGRVTVRLVGGAYNVDIAIRDGQFTCGFNSSKFEEVDEGDLRFSEKGCRVRVLQQDEDRLSVEARGCESYCGVGTDLNIASAVRRR